MLKNCKVSAKLLFQEVVHQLYPSKNIHWLDLDAFFPSLSHNKKREALVELFGNDMNGIVKRIETDNDFFETYLGFKAFLSEELNFSSNMSVKSVSTILFFNRKE